MIRTNQNPKGPTMTHRTLAELCQLSYQHPQLIQAQTAGTLELAEATGHHYCPRCQRHTWVDIQAQVHFREDGHIVIVFRGSDTPVDWLSNLDARPCHHYGMPIHAGFLHSYEALRPRLIAMLPWARSITITGHSKGGGEAIPAAYDLYQVNGGRTPVQVVTFGAPRVARRDYRRALDAVIPVTRYVHAADPVPWLPPLTFGYRHLGRLQRLGSPWASLAGCWRQRRLRLRRDHPIQAYLAALPEA